MKMRKLINIKLNLKLINLKQRRTFASFIRRLRQPVLLLQETALLLPVWQLRS